MEVNPKIRDLPEWIKQKAIKNTRILSSLYGEVSEERILEMHINNAFGWNRSEEGSSFWLDIYDKRFPNPPEPVQVDNYELF